MNQAMGCEMNMISAYARNLLKVVLLQLYMSCFFTEKSLFHSLNLIARTPPANYADN
jgi:hypothetical protein